MMTGKLTTRLFYFIGTAASVLTKADVHNFLYRKSDVSILCSDSILADLLPTLKEQFPTSEINVKSNQQVRFHYLTSIIIQLFIHNFC